ncbi:putative 40S ribosomal protein S14 [Hibiscus syriacus]|uniref:40S ribosomal protein S14 n=1 Tax=Hibiscus syriacus TaxID=106335 RepID=A0A6A3CXM2_HIBSY|nr:uncharacterized protein LOC120217707 [Hibiscus syriacus]KAE8734325.1 putative 40S ribosomal protein S14 [Hibiscus syriacus]
MASIDSHRDGADIYHGAALCKQKLRELLDKFRFPRALLPLSDLNEFGFNSITGFIWLKQKKKFEYKFKSIGKTVSYDSEVTTFIEERRMRRLTGVKSKEMFIWITVSEISILDIDPCKITFASSSGLAKTFPIEAFALEDERK